MTVYKLPVTVNLELDIVKKIDEEADKQGIKRAVMVRMMLKKYFEVTRNSTTDGDKNSFLKTLDDKFTTAEAIKCLVAKGNRVRTAERILRDALDRKLIEKLSIGIYQKKTSNS